jgi:uncharacterized membrane protein YdjX (TVP38/TMEM64 family)
VTAYLHDAQDWLRANRGLGAFVLALTQAVCVCLSGPVALVETFTAFVFGWPLGLLISYPVIIATSCATFWIGRRFLVAHAEQVLDSLGTRARVFKRMLGSHPWKMTFLIRMMPMPYVITTLGLVALPVSTRIFTVCTIFGLLLYSIKVRLDIWLTRVVELSFSFQNSHLNSRAPVPLSIPFSLAERSHWRLSQVDCRAKPP